MRTTTLTTLSASVLLALCFSASAAPMTQVDYKASKASIAAQRKADNAACNMLSGNTKDICEEEAKGHNNIALAELEANYEPSAKHSYQVDVAKADAAFAVSKEKCDDQAGNAKDVCRAEAKSIHTVALTDAKLAERTAINNGKAAEKNTDAQKVASADIQKAEYKTAVEKCGAFASDVKTKCIADAKTQYGQN